VAGAENSVNHMPAWHEAANDKPPTLEGDAGTTRTPPSGPPLALGQKHSRPLVPSRQSLRYGQNRFYAIKRWTDGNGWRGPVDLIAVGGYVLTAVPILVLVVLTFSGGSAKAQTWWAWAALVVAHVAMTFGMMAPFVLGWVDAAPAAHGM